MSRFLSVTLTGFLAAGSLSAEPLGLGREALPEEIAAWDIDIRPDGLGLPEGAGDVWAGEELYEAQCAHCHGTFGEAVGAWPKLAGGFGTLTAEHPEKTVGSYWPYLSTVFDYVYRAMPYGYAQSLTADETYAITAYLLYLNDLVDDDFELNHENLAQTRLPNEENFYLDDRVETEWPRFTQDACVSDCRPGVAEVTMRAAVLDVTPDDGRPQPQQASAEGADEPETPATADPELVAAGEAAYRACAACHEVGEGARSRVGPHLNDVIGRVAGSVESFRYSNALQSAGADGLIWTEEEIVAFIENPRGYLRGNRMSYGGMRNEGDRDAIIAYLSTFSD